MRSRAPHLVKAIARTAISPWRRVISMQDRWTRGQIYGWRQPRWWPDRLAAAWPGPRSPHDDKSVVVFAGAQRYEFAPAALGRYRGHVHHGTLRPDAADVGARLARMQLPTGAARTLAIVSSFEGGFDAIQTYDRGKFSWGFIQFALTGGLPRLLDDLKRLAPEIFAEHFVAAGLDVGPGGIVVQRNGRTLTGRRAHDRLHDDPSCWLPFINASRVSQVQDIQVANAYAYYYAHPLKTTVTIGSDEVTLGALFADSEHGRTVVCDRAVNRGVGHTTVLFRTAVARSRARHAGDAALVLDCVRALEATDGVRLDAIASELASGTASIDYSGGGDSGSLVGA